ncbi:pyruvate dehydrogenase (acetyl-transferring), homodimeric type [Cupriavidus pauculus]|uniref:pyruvate dehydrogenase (acetyl-transferring), homodimeric type n=1 Tax=Cupriavidus pauculus TaxID=82633 RepID=UPI001EE16D4F|nr:pyruvate dehydrogenase (acetyl-transferring), homodimeric type [Cupriavidus pauculus]GJG98625.1 pyruvate dehydrogenase (acetyl-transferring), homodimeric type [Cupriavidus pauculus]
MAAVPNDGVNPRNDDDPQETAEWIDALDGVVSHVGMDRAHFLIERQIEFVRVNGESTPFATDTPYVNTIPPTRQPAIPGDQAMEHTIRSYMRWNAIAMVLRAGRETNVGGHIASFASAATLYDVGFNHFWHGASANHGGDLVFFQGHSSPGIYSRAFLEGRLSDAQLDSFRQETGGHGMPSYPHPWLMRDFWQFPTVSMGLGPLMAIYQARFMKYIEARGVVTTQGRKVWAFLGDGEMDEPESLGAIGMAARERLDNLIFVVNANLQRLDGPVRGNGKIIQELERLFSGAGWNVIKVIWGSRWDALLARDRNGALMRRMMEVVDGEYQTYKSKSGAYVREKFFNTPELKALVADWTDDDIWALNRGGHDPHKIYAAYAQAAASNGRPTVILAKTIKGYGMGEAGQAMNNTHQQKKMQVEQLKAFRDQFKLPISDDAIVDVPYLKFDEGSPEFQYLHARRQELGGYVPARRQTAASLPTPELGAFDALLKGTGEGRKMSTTMAFVRFLGVLLKDKALGKRVVPIVPDESRTFGMEGLFRQIGIWNQDGQRYEPEDSGQLMFYRESETGQILQEGINEAGGMSDWIAAATSYSTHAEIMIPFFVFYSMFGFQRVGDLVWAAGDMRSRGFLLGGTAGRTTLNGEGLQHQDGHSLLWASSVPNCISYDPTFSYELAVIMQDGLRRMVTEQEDVFYYVTVMNENYEHPAMPERDGVANDIIRGLYLFRKSAADSAMPRVQLMGAGTIFNEVIAAAALLETDWSVAADLWSAPGITELAREGREVRRWNLLHPTEVQRVSHVERLLGGASGPVIASTDYVRTLTEQLREFIPQRFVALGTDGFGRSDTREKLRDFFEIDRYWITVTALKSLADEGTIAASVVADALAKYGFDPSRPNPMSV